MVPNWRNCFFFKIIECIYLFNNIQVAQKTERFLCNGVLNTQNDFCKKTNVKILTKTCATVQFLLGTILKCSIYIFLMKTYFKAQLIQRYNV
jgi:hypothetical protein